MTNTEDYNSSITREQFLFTETREIAQLICDGLSLNEIIDFVYSKNLFQYPTQRSLNRMTKLCYARLMEINNSFLIRDIVNEPSSCAKQICLYAYMKQNKLVRDFFVNVIGEKYRTCNTHLTNLDIGDFFYQIAHSSATASSWSDVTINKLRQVLKRVLIQAGYIDTVKSEKLNYVNPYSPLISHIIESKENYFLPVFNYLY